MRYPCDRHDTEEYIRALKNVGLGGNYWLLRMTFEEALDVFPDEHFDFVYIDGYAHNGELHGKTMFDWFPKVKVGGMIAGHDYHKKWPLVQASVDALSECLSQPVLRTAMSDPPDPKDKFPSWAIMKETADNPAYPDHLTKLPRNMRR